LSYTRFLTTNAGQMTCKFRVIVFILQALNSKKI